MIKRLTVAQIKKRMGRILNDRRQMRCADYSQREIYRNEEELQFLRRLLAKYSKKDIKEKQAKQWLKGAQKRNFKPERARGYNFQGEKII
jgi:hypothetical protein